MKKMFLICFAACCIWFCLFAGEVSGEAHPAAEQVKSSLPWVVAITDFVTIDSITIEDFNIVNKPVEVPQVSVISNADRLSVCPAGLGFVLLEEARDAIVSNDVNRWSAMEENDFARAKAVAAYQSRIREGIRNVVIGADILGAELAARPEIFRLGDEWGFNTAAEALLSSETLPANYLELLAAETGVTHVIQGTVSDLRTSTRTFSGYGITAETLVYELDVVLKVLDLKAGSVIYSKLYTGKVKLINNNDVTVTDNSDNFMLALKEALKLAGSDLAAFAVKSEEGSL